MSNVVTVSILCFHSGLRGERPPVEPVLTREVDTDPFRLFDQWSAGLSPAEVETDPPLPPDVAEEQARLIRRELDNSRGGHVVDSAGGYVPRPRMSHMRDGSRHHQLRCRECPATVRISEVDLNRVLRHAAGIEPHMIPLGGIAGILRAID